MTNLKPLLAPKPILVTGSHRSGSTWVGRILASSPSVAYIHEPFSLGCRPGICRAQFNYWFPCITAENDAEYYEDIKSTLAFSYGLKQEIKSVQTIRDLLRLARDCTSFSLYRFSRAKPLIKDPIAFFSAEWLAEKFNMDIVILIRHPAAFTSSLKVKNWRFPFLHFLRQPRLMQAYLKPFEREIVEFADQERDIVDQAVLLWKIFHHTILVYQEKHQDWIFVRHEDLSSQPLTEFESLFQSLGLDFSETVKKKIIEHSSKRTPFQNNKFFKEGKKIQTKRNSQDNLQTWKQRLTPSEIHRIRSCVEEISSPFYSNSDW